MDPLPLYRRLASHYREAIISGALSPGDRLPSLRELMQRHGVSLSTALQLCRYLEAEGSVEARPRSGYFVCLPTRDERQALAEPQAGPPPDPAQYVGMNERVSEFVVRGRQGTVRVNFSSARSAPSLYPGEALRNAAVRALRQQPDLLVKVASHGGNPAFRSVLARRALASGMVLSPDEVLITQGCIEALNLALRAVTAPGDIVAVESPSFYGLLQVLETLGLRALRSRPVRKPAFRWRRCSLRSTAIRTSRRWWSCPTCKIPSGAIMPDEHKERLVALCRERDVALIEDDTYSALIDDGLPRRALKSWDPRRRCDPLRLAAQGAGAG